MKKYELTDESMEYGDRILYRIKSLMDLSCYNGVGKGDLGGWVSGEHNLSQDGNCWIYGEAMVMDNAHVSGSARVEDFAVLLDDVKVYSSAKICNKARLQEYAEVFDNARVYDSATILGRAKVFDNSIVRGCAIVKGSPKIHGDTDILDDAIVDIENKSLYNLVIADDTYCIGETTEEDDTSENSEIEYKIIDGIKFRKKIIWEQV